MVPAAETQAAAPALKARRRPPRATKRALSVAEAAEQFEKAKALEAKAKALLDEAKPVLLAWFERTGKRTYEERIEAQSTGGGLVLDTEKVKAFLGRRLPEFQKTQAVGTTLKLLRRDGG